MSGSLRAPLPTLAPTRLPHADGNAVRAAGYWRRRRDIGGGGGRDSLRPPQSPRRRPRRRRRLTQQRKQARGEAASAGTRNARRGRAGSAGGKAKTPRMRERGRGRERGTREGTREGDESTRCLCAAAHTHWLSRAGQQPVLTVRARCAGPAQPRYSTPGCPRRPGVGPAGLGPGIDARGRQSLPRVSAVARAAQVPHAKPARQLCSTHTQLCTHSHVPHPWQRVGTRPAAPVPETTLWRGLQAAPVGLPSRDPDSPVRVATRMSPIRRPTPSLPCRGSLVRVFVAAAAPS